jgi:hypothetical protein
LVTLYIIQLGTESYFGADGTGGMIVQYWRSIEQLNAYARSQTNTHYSPWKKLFMMGKESTDVSFWHETFQVKAGQYECIYV